MKIACSSASFAGALARGELTQLEWLDLCANELEIDGVVFEAAHFPRIDGEYLAQLKKFAVDLGLTVAALAADEVLATGGARWLEVASALGAPLVMTRAASSGEASAWGTFTSALAARAREAKSANVTLALRDEEGTLCAGLADLARAGKDVDSAWLRYALRARALVEIDSSGALRKTVIALHTIEDLENFAADGDPEGSALAHGLRRFRGFVVLDGVADRPARGDAYHRAIERFRTLRATHLASNAPID